MISKSLLIAIGSLVLSAGSSSAISIVFSVSEGIQPTNVGTITLTEINPTTVDVLVDLINTSYGFLNTGGPHTPFTFSISGTETGVSASFLQPIGGVPFSLNLAGGGNTPFGTYGIAIDSSANNGSGNAYYGDLQFRLVRPTGLIASDFVANGDGYFFGADLTNGQNTGAQGWKTGTRVTTGDPVPDGGSTIALMGLSLLGMTGVRKALAKAKV